MRHPAVRRLVPTAVVVASASLLLSGAAGVSAAPATPPVPASTQTVTHGVVAPGHSIPESTSPVRAAAQPRGVRQLAHPRSGAATAPLVSNNGSPATSASLPVNIDGVSSLDSQQTNYNQMFEPPDQGLCEGNGYVLEPVNSAYTFYTSAGARIEGPFNVNDLFDEGGQQFTSDPRCYYDTTTSRWFATILFLNASFTASHLDVAVSNDSNPTDLWTIYQFDTTDLGAPNGNQCPCFGDQPRLGIDQTDFYVSSDEFSIQGSAFNGGQIFAFTKADLVAGAGVHWVEWNDLTMLGQPIDAIQPAITNGSAPAEYFLNSLDLYGGGASQLGVWALTDPGAVASGGTPTLSSLVIKSESYALPHPAPQKGSSSRLDAGDDRMQQTQFINGLVWGELDTSAQAAAGVSSAHDSAAWFAVSPSLSGGSLSSATVADQGYVAQTATDLIYPALEVDNAGNAVMVFTSTSRLQYPSAAYSYRLSTANGFTQPAIAAAGNGSYDPHATRWGDYSWADVDLTTDTWWLATEYIPPPARQTTTGQRNWGTRVFEVSLG